MIPTYQVQLTLNLNQLHKLRKLYLKNILQSILVVKDLRSIVHDWVGSISIRVGHTYIKYYLNRISILVILYLYTPLYTMLILLQFY